MIDITYTISPPVTNDDMNTLFLASWPDWRESDFQPVLSRGLLYGCAYEGEWLVMPKPPTILLPRLK